VKIAINGRFLTQRVTGVQRMAREFVWALDKLIADGALADVGARLLVPPGTELGDLSLSAIRVETLGGARSHFWEQLVLPRHVGDNWLLNLGNTAPLVSLGRNRKVAVVIHDVSYRVFPSAYKLSYRLSHRLIDAMIMRRARVIVTVADTEKAMLASLYPGTVSKIHTAQNGGWRELPAARGPVPLSERTYGLYVGSLSRRKNIETVLDVAVRLAEQRRLPFKIVGAGSPILSDIRIDIPEEVRPLIEFCGQIETAEDLADIYRGAAFLLFPSFYEASALPPIEAMAHGCPVIVSDIPSLRERCGDAAAYCDPYDRDDVFAATRTVLDDLPFAEGMVERGYAMARHRSWRTQAFEVMERLRRVDGA
jgi:glycosyltransferase involved in cell wall biosynthesis